MALSSDIDYFSKNTFQMSNLWDFFIFDNPTNLAGGLNSVSTIGSAIGAVSNIGNTLSSSSNLAQFGASLFFDNYLAFKVTETTLPLPGLATETSRSGLKHYSERKYEGDFSITIMEDVAFSSYNYFDSWMKQVYNFDTQKWKKNPPSRTGMLFYWDPTLTIPTATFMYEDLKVRGIEDFNITRANTEVLTLKVNLTFNKVSNITTSSILDTIKNKTTDLIKGLF